MMHSLWSQLRRCSRSFSHGPCLLGVGMGVLCSSFLLSLLVTPETSLAALDLLASVQRGWLEVSLLAPLFLVAGWSLVGGA